MEEESCDSAAFGQGPDPRIVSGFFGHVGFRIQDFEFGLL